MIETQLQALLLLRAPHALPDLRAFRRNIHKLEIEGRAVSSGIKGQCDLYWIQRGGLHIETELKSATGVLTKEQKVWRAWCQSSRIPYLLLRAKIAEASETTVSRWIVELRHYIQALTATSENVPS